MVDFDCCQRPFGVLSWGAREGRSATGKRQLFFCGKGRAPARRGLSAAVGRAGGSAKLGGGICGSPSIVEDRLGPSASPKINRPAVSNRAARLVTPSGCTLTVGGFDVGQDAFGGLKG